MLTFDGYVRPCCIRISPEFSSFYSQYLMHGVGDALLAHASPKALVALGSAWCLSHRWGPLRLLRGFVCHDRPQECYTGSSYYTCHWWTCNQTHITAPGLRKKQLLLITEALGKARHVRCRRCLLHVVTQNPSATWPSVRASALACTYL